jgi:hypothetical protein
MYLAGGTQAVPGSFVEKGYYQRMGFVARVAFAGAQLGSSSLTPAFPIHFRSPSRKRAAAKVTAISPPLNTVSFQR